MRITIVVTHLLGTGHLARALTLGRAFVAAGDDVTLISGGKPVHHFDIAGMSLIQLPPLQSNGTDFTTLLTDRGDVADATYLAERQAALIDHASQAAPDALMTELFPFGRRILKAEFVALLEHMSARPKRPLILSSIRDILAPPSKPAKVEMANAIVDQFYDAVLVHSDPDIVPLDRSWPVSTTLRPKLHYTGFVAPAPPAPNETQSGEVVVSAGGGVIGDAVFQAAIGAARLDPARNWRLLVSGEDGERRAAIAQNAPKNVEVEAPRPDFRELLAGAAVSVSMCGYNTALDLLQTGVSAVLVPFDDGAEVEQSLRSDALGALPAMTVIRQSDLSGPILAEAVAALAQGARRPPQTIGMDGAGQSVAIVHTLHAGQSHAT